MSANNQVIVRRKQNGLYEIRNCWAEEGTVEDNTINMVADDIDGLDEAIEKANSYLEECEDEGFPVEYGLVILK